MATASKKPVTASLPPEETSSTIVRAVVGLCDAVYRFLASLKLAVISLGTLAGVLAYSTFFEKWYGTAAVQEWIYQSTGFSVLLAFLAANILCAALIRYPWKKRQTGFVVTHIGLLVLLAGSYYSVKTSDEGQVAALEGEVKDEIVRNDYPVVRVRQMDRDDPKKIEREWELPFRPGAFAWGPGQARPGGVVDAVLTPVRGVDRNPTEILTRENDPFRFVVKSHIPASAPAIKHTADPSGSPMAKIRVRFKPPRLPAMVDVFEDEERWFVTDKRLNKVVKVIGSPARIAFYYVDRSELIDDFKNPPEVSGLEGVARFHYSDQSGKNRRYDWALDGQAGKTVTLPESDLTVKFIDVVGFPAAEAGLAETLGESTVPIAEFEVSKSGQPPIKHMGLASLPTFPNVIPARAGATPEPLVTINYYLPPVLDPKTNGRFALVEVLGTPDGTLYSRIYARDKSGKAVGVLKGKPEKVTKGKEVVAFNETMSLAFEVEDFLPAGVESTVYEPIVLPPGQMGNGIPASLVEMTVSDPDDHSKEATKEFYIRRSATLDPAWQTVTFPNGKVYQIAYDADRRPLGFELKMVDFQRGFDPGTEKASRFSSDVLLTDKAEGIENQKIHISMNEPLTHRGYTFYQSSFIRERVPGSDRETGRVQSVLQVGLNPGRRVMYLGCALIVLGAFLQFYMRAGVFSDGGRREREKEKAKAVKLARARGQAVDPALLIPEPATSLRADDAEETL